MGSVVRIIMTARVGEIGARAAASCVYVESKETSISIRQSSYYSLYQNTILSLKKSHLSTQSRVGIRATNNRYGVG